MAWTYSGNPASSPKDSVRFLIADTDADEAFVTDEEIAWSLSQVSQNIYQAASLVARSLSAKFSTLSDETIGPLQFKYAERAKNYEKTADRLEKQGSKSTSLTGIYCGGCDVSEKESNEYDTSLVQPEFKKGITDYVSDISEETDL